MSLPPRARRDAHRRGAWGSRLPGRPDARTACPASAPARARIRQLDSLDADVQRLEDQESDVAQSDETRHNVGDRFHRVDPRSRIATAVTRVMKSPLAVI